MVLLLQGISLCLQPGLKRVPIQASLLYKSLVANSLLLDKISLHSMLLLGMVTMLRIRWVLLSRKQVFFA